MKKNKTFGSDIKLLTFAGRDSMPRSTRQEETADVNIRLFYVLVRSFGAVTWAVAVERVTSMYDRVGCFLPFDISGAAKCHAKRLVSERSEGSCCRNFHDMRYYELSDCGEIAEAVLHALIRVEKIDVEGRLKSLWVVDF